MDSGDGAAPASGSARAVQHQPAGNGGDGAAGNGGDEPADHSGDEPAGHSGDEAADEQPTAPLLPGLTDLVPVGRGGDSTVYRAHQVTLDRDVAVKVLDLTAPDDLRRFEREIRITVQLGRLHPNIMKVLDTRQFGDGRPCIVMDFYEMGSTHDRLLATGPFAVADVVTIGRVICDALGFAHSRGVLHRDVKPQNILILPTSYVLADFGIARPMDAGHTSSLDRLSYRHASPEVLDGQPPEPTDDLWSLGSTLHTLLTGRAPFSSDDPADDTALAYLRRVRLGQRRSLPSDVPPALRAVIDRAMSPDRSGRYQDAPAMLADLHALDREVDAWAPGGAASVPADRPAADPEPDAAAPVSNVTTSTATTPGWTPSGPPAVAPAPSPSGAPAAAPASSPSGPPVAPPSPTPTTPTTPPPAPATPAPPAPFPDEEAAWAPDATPAPPDSPASSAPAPAAPDAPSEPDHRVPTPAVDPAAGVARSVAGSLAITPDADDAAAARADDAAPTGLRPDPDAPVDRAHPGNGITGGAGSTAGSSSSSAAEKAGPSHKVRLRIVLLAGAMLVASAVVAYLIARPSSTPPGTTAAGSGSASAPGHTGTLAPSIPRTSSTVPVAGGNLDLDYPKLRPTLLTVKIEGDTITVRFKADSSEIARVGLVDITHYDIASHTGPVPPLLGVAKPKSGIIVATLPAQDDQDDEVRVVLVGYSADASRRGLSKIRGAER